MGSIASVSELTARFGHEHGGRAADKLVFGEAMAGAIGDLKMATRLARVMVTQLGMSERLGPVYYQLGEDHVFLGKEMVESLTFSEGTARLIDEEIQRLLTEAEQRASELVEHPPRATRSDRRSTAHPRRTRPGRG